MMKTQTFKSYKHQVRPVVVYPALFDDKTKLPKPIKSLDANDISLHEILDTITLTMQAGNVSTHGWPQQFFANKKAFNEFIEQLSEYDDCFRITDEWWLPLSHLAFGNNGGGDEEGFITTADMAQAIASKAEDDGLLVNFGKKTPVYKYSPQECEEADYKLTVNSLARIYRSDMTQTELAEDDRLSDVYSFGRDYLGTALTPERHAAAVAEAKAKKPVKANTKAKAKAKK